MKYTITLEISGGTDDLEEARETAERIFEPIFPTGEFGGLAQLSSMTVTGAAKLDPKLSPEELADLRTAERMREAHELHDLEGVAPGCNILFRAAMMEDLSSEVELERFKLRAVRSLCDGLSMARLRSLAKFWAADTARDKRSLALRIASAWASSVHPTYRPRSNHEIVTGDCPAKWYR